MAAKSKGPKGLSKLTLPAQQSHERCVCEGERLVSYWGARGHKVKVEIVPTFQHVNGKATLAVIGFAVTSDMVNGLPKDYVTGPPPVVHKWRRRVSKEAGGLQHY